MRTVSLNQDNISFFLIISKIDYFTSVYPRRNQNIIEFCFKVSINGLERVFSFLEEEKANTEYNRLITEIRNYCPAVITKDPYD